MQKKMNGSVGEWRIDSRYCIKCFEGMGSRSHDLRAELAMHFLIVDCDTI